MTQKATIDAREKPFRHGMLVIGPGEDRRKRSAKIAQRVLNGHDFYFTPVILNNPSELGMLNKDHAPQHFIIAHTVSTPEEARQYEAEIENVLILPVGYERGSGVLSQTAKHLGVELPPVNSLPKAIFSSDEDTAEDREIKDTELFNQIAGILENYEN